MTLEDILTNRTRLSEDILREVQESAATYGVSIARADVKDLVFPGNLLEIVNRVLADERMSQARLVEARTKAEVQKIEAQTKMDVQRLQAQTEADRGVGRRAGQAAVMDKRLMRAGVLRATPLSGTQDRAKPQRVVWIADYEFEVAPEVRRWHGPQRPLQPSSQPPAHRPPGFPQSRNSIGPVHSSPFS
jgi:hypothetical protein